MPDVLGDPAVNWAAYMGDAEFVTLLVEAGADVDARDAIGFTPLFAAVRRGSGEVVEALLGAGAHADALALPRGMSMSALFLAAETGQLELVRRLVAAGAPLYARSTLAQSALGWSLAFGRGDAAELLLELGADASGVDALGRTPARIAREAGLADLAERLEALNAGG